MVNDFTIGEYESGVHLVCPLCGPLWWEGGLGGMTLPAVQQLGDRHYAQKHDPGRFPSAAVERAWVA